MAPNCSFFFCFTNYRLFVAAQLSDPLGWVVLSRRNRDTQERSSTWKEILFGIAMAYSPPDVLRALTSI